jgi:hypothetical protein
MLAAFCLYVIDGKGIRECCEVLAEAQNEAPLGGK